ncbi:hypothetical protein [Paracoccus yeei]|uniref:hypothetical protein n=1 Tax=Paracoccus yeei TaxID=147645 RepID=UPI001C8CFEF2|nr:hypothetical protein [Paracoccus yeei]
MEYFSQFLEFIRSLPYWTGLATVAVCFVLMTPGIWRRHRRFKQSRAKLLELRRSAEAVGFQTTWWDLLPEGNVSDATFERPLNDDFKLQIYAQQSGDFHATIYAFTYRNYRSYELAKNRLQGVSSSDIKKLTYAVIDDLVFAGELDRAAIPEAFKKAA